MEWNEKIEFKNKIITVRFYGEFKKEKLLPVVKQKRLKALNMGLKVIFDFRESYINISFSDAYHWIPKHYDEINLQLKLVPVAFIPGENNEKMFSFLETTFFNKGAKVRLCKNKNDAKTWIMSKSYQGLDVLDSSESKVSFQKAY